MSFLKKCQKICFLLVLLKDESNYPVSLKKSALNFNCILFNVFSIVFFYHARFFRRPLFILFILVTFLAMVADASDILASSLPGSHTDILPSSLASCPRDKIYDNNPTPGHRQSHAKLPLTVFNSTGAPCRWKWWKTRARW